MTTERNLVIYANEPDEIAHYLMRFGVALKMEGRDPSHWCAELGQDTIHVCEERRKDVMRVPDEPGAHGVWHFFKHKRGPKVAQGAC